MIFLVYDSLRRSHYSKYIKIDVGKKKIFIYLKNEAEFNGLMEKLEYGSFTGVNSSADTRTES